MKREDIKIGQAAIIDDFEGFKTVVISRYHDDIEYVWVKYPGYGTYDVLISDLLSFDDAMELKASYRQV